MINFLKSILRATLITPIVNKDKNFINNIKVEYNKILNFGDKNKNLIFYIIKRNFLATGFFSNIFFVIDHLNYALKNRLVPFVDMENFTTVYNEKNIVNNTRNSWEYYFYNFFKKKNIYKSCKVIFSNNLRNTKDIFKKNNKFKKIFKKYIKILPQHLIKYKQIKSIIFGKKEKILGISISGGLQKIVRRHYFPLKPEEILEISKKIYVAENCTKVFLVTRDLDYYNKLKDYYKDKFIEYDLLRSKSTFLGSHNIHFEQYCRKNHRYKLGQETLIDGLLLSKTPILLCDYTNISLFAFLNSKKNTTYLIRSDLNSNNIFLARWLWYLKCYFPIIFGKIKYKIFRYK